MKKINFISPLTGEKISVNVIKEYTIDNVVYYLVKPWHDRFILLRRIAA